MKKNTIPFDEREDQKPGIAIVKPETTEHYSNTRRNEGFSGLENQGNIEGSQELKDNIYEKQQKASMLLDSILENNKINADENFNATWENFKSNSITSEALRQKMLIFENEYMPLYFEAIKQPNIHIQKAGLYMIWKELYASENIHNDTQFFIKIENSILYKVNEGMTYELFSLICRKDLRSISFNKESYTRIISLFRSNNEPESNTVRERIIRKFESNPTLQHLLQNPRGHQEPSKEDYAIAIKEIAQESNISDSTHKRIEQYHKNIIEAYRAGTKIENILP